METEERADDSAPEEGTPAADEDRPDWWHRDHPVFTPLSGFFTGLVAITLLPGIYAALLSAMFSAGTAEDMFPYVLVVLALPLALVAVPRTRRFGAYMLLGMVLTALVVGGVAALVLWVMVESQS